MSLAWHARGREALELLVLLSTEPLCARTFFGFPSDHESALAKERVYSRPALWRNLLGETPLRVVKEGAEGAQTRSRLSLCYFELLEDAPPSRSMIATQEVRYPSRSTDSRLARRPGLSRNVGIACGKRGRPNALVEGLLKCVAFAQC